MKLPTKRKDQSKESLQATQMPVWLSYFISEADSWSAKFLSKGLRNWWVNLKDQFKWASKVLNSSRPGLLLQGKQLLSTEPAFSYNHIHAPIFHKEHVSSAAMQEPPSQCQLVKYTPWNPKPHPPPPPEVSCAWKPQHRHEKMTATRVLSLSSIQEEIKTSQDRGQPGSTFWVCNFEQEKSSFLGTQLKKIQPSPFVLLLSYVPFLFFYINWH